MLLGMSLPHVENLEIRPVAANEQMESLKLLFSSLSPSQQLAEAQNLFQLAREGKVTLEGLLRADLNGRLAGVIWAQKQIGRTAVVWMPRLASGPFLTAEQRQPLAASLVAAADTYLQAEDVCLAQVLSPDRDSVVVAGFEGCGYEYLAELEYLAGFVASCEEPARDRLEFETYSTANYERFVEALSRTYIETRDCPVLNGVRSDEDVLAGYQATGVFAPERWFLLRYDGRDAGCLLLADHPETDQYELVYMGLVPEVRGAGLGEVVTRYAMWQAKQAGRQRLVLAVDAKNGPAKAMYGAAGLVRWQQRYVWVRRFEGKT